MGSGKKDKARQSTLFGLPAKAPESATEGGKKGKKRKNEADKEGASTETEAPKAKTMRPLSSFLAPKTSKPTSVEERTQTRSDAQQLTSESEVRTDSAMEPNNSGGGLSKADQGSKSVSDGSPTNGEESQMSLMSINLSQSLPPRIRSTHPNPDEEDGAARVLETDDV